MKTLDNLKSLGYDVEVKENNIKLLYRGEGKPDKNRVLPLLEELKVNKDKAIKEIQKSEHISDEVLQDLFLETMNKINNEYLTGTVKYIQEHHKDLDDDIDKADNRINEVWKECNKGEANIEDFKTALDSYQTLYLEAIELFESKKVYENKRKEDVISTGNLLTFYTPVKH